MPGSVCTDLGAAGGGSAAGEPAEPAPLAIGAPHTSQKSSVSDEWPFGHVDVQFYEGRSLDGVTQVETIASYGAQLVHDYARYTAGQAMLETAERMTPEEGEPAVQQYLLLVGGLRALVNAEPPRPRIEAIRVVDMSSSEPVGTQMLGAKLAARKAVLIDAPVSGGVNVTATPRIGVPPASVTFASSEARNGVLIANTSVTAAETAIEAVGKAAETECSLDSNTKEVVRWIGTARAPVAGSYSLCSEQQ